jgi:DNA repair exonuclease SbcCD ATPase subunit
MKLLHLHAHNVFSIGTIDLDLKDRGLLLITGWSKDDKNGNMAGKSSVANHCISWGLYGRTVHGIKADSVINTSIPNAKHCAVRIHFEGIDGETYRIYRARKPNSLVLSKCIGSHDGDLIYSGEWDDLSKRNEKDTQELIDKLLGRDHKTFIQSDFFGQGRERSFLALPGSDQKAVIEEILPLNSLDEWRDKAKQCLSDTDLEVKEAEREYQMSQQREITAMAHLSTLESQEAGWDINNDVELEAAQEKLNKVLVVDEAVADEILTLKESLPHSDAMAVLKKQTKLSIELTTHIGSLGHKIDTLTADIDSRSSRPDVCMSCNQALPEDRIVANSHQIADDKLKRELLIKERGEKKAKLYLANSMIAVCNEVLVLEGKANSKNQEASIREEIRIKKAAVNPFTSIVAEHRGLVEKEQYIGEAHRLDAIKKRELWEHYNFWFKAFGTDLKTMLFNQVCPFLEKKANQFLRELDNGQIKVKFRTVKDLKSGDTRDTFCVTASSDTGSNVFELFSGAEKQLTSFAVGMALSELASMQVEGASSFMILDEPFLYQSPENCERIISFVTTHLVGDKSTILLISNEDNLQNLVPNRVNVVKEKGVTSIASS